jgi:hypothetical protein
MEYRWLCPNCGEQIKAPSDSVALMCDSCGKSLLFSSEHKLILAEPITTYHDSSLASDDLGGRQRLFPGAGPETLQLSDHRKRKADQLARERVSQERKTFRQGLVSGFLVIILGGLLLLSIGIHIYYFESNWLDLAGIVVGGCFLGLGLFIVVWFLRAMRLGIG